MTNNNLFKKVGVLYASSIFSILLGFLVSIFNSRVLGASNFGNFKFIETVARFISSIVNVGFFTSITRLVALNNNELKEKTYIGLFTIIFGIVSIIGIIIMLIFSFVEPLYFNNGLSSTFRIYFFIIAAIIGKIALLEILKGLNRIYTLSFLTSIPLLIYLVLAYFINKILPFNLDFILLFYYGITLLIIILIIIKLKPKFDIKKSLISELLLENKNNGRPVYFGSLAGVATTHIAGLSISYFLDNTQVGFYMLALTICGPLLVIPSVLGTTFFKKFVDLKKIPSKVFLFSLLITLIALIFFYSLIDVIIVYFYTEEFLPVASISKYLIIGFIFHGIGDLINRFLGAKGKGKLLRNAAIFVGIVNVLGYTILIKNFNINGAVFTKILASGLYLIIMMKYYNNFIRKINV